MLTACAATTTAKTNEEVVAERAQAKWTAIVAGDYQAAYQYMSPSSRTVISEQAYRNSMKPGFHKGAKVVGVKCESADICEVRLEIEYEYAGSRVKAGLPEKWIKQDGNWWYPQV